MKSIQGSRPHAGLWALTAIGVLSLSLSACLDAVAPGNGAARTGTSGLFSNSSNSGRQIADEYIVVFESFVSDVGGRAKGLLNAHGGNLHATYSSALKGFSAHMTAQAAAEIEEHPDVAYVEADQEFTVAGTQTGASWGLDRIDQATLPLDGSFSYPNTGAGVNIYIIDSGIRRTHTQFGGRVVAAFSSIADGYGADGCHFHGTHVAGVIGGVTYGVAKSATLHSVRAFDCSGIGTTSSIVAAVDWITANNVRPAVGSMSISGPGSAAVNAAVQASINAGVTYAVAAGNNVGSDACGYSPAGVVGAITVAAIGGMDAQASYTNVGSCVDLYAPGTNIYSAWNTDDSAIGLNSGTSQASAFVAGAAALYLQANPSASPAQVQQALVSGATTGVVTGVTGGTANRLLRVNGSGGGEVPPPPPPSDAAPTASFTSSCLNTVCTLNGGGSTDDYGIVSYAWTFGDGTTGSGASVTHVYPKAGRYRVTLRVTDTSGQTGAFTKTVQAKK